jgi:hypothetical protein
MKNSITKASLIIGLMAPVCGFAAVFAAPAKSEAQSLGCSCLDYCDTGSNQCTNLICADGTSKVCNGVKKNQE